jgi:hypothetical protein
MLLTSLSILTDRCTLICFVVVAWSGVVNNFSQNDVFGKLADSMKTFYQHNAALGDEEWPHDVDGQQRRTFETINSLFERANSLEKSSDRRTIRLRMLLWWHAAFARLLVVLWFAQKNYWCPYNSKKNWS